MSSLEIPAIAAYGAFRISSADRLGEMPPWEQLPPEARADWRAVADAVRMVSTETDTDRALLTAAADALWECTKVTLTVKPNLDKPYNDAPEWSPWTRWIEPASRRSHDLAIKIRRHLKKEWNNH